MFNNDDIVWVKTTEYSASRAVIIGTHDDGYYVRFIDKTFDQDGDHRFPVLARQVFPLDYIGWEK